MQRFFYTLISVYFLSFVQAQTIDVGLNKYAFSGQIRTITKDGNGNVYVGGDFAFVGLWTGSGTLLNPTTGAFDPNFAKVADGIVFTVLAIPAAQGGGWYIGGSFTQVNGEVRNRLARINADGTLHTFNPNVNGPVYGLALDGSGNLYVGGNFTQVSSQTRNRLCALDANGNVLSFNPNSAGIVYALAFDGSGNLYVGGSFTTISSTTRNRLCKFDASGALVTAYDPNISNGSVRALALDGNGNLYVGGDFTTVGGSTARNRLCKFDASGNLTSFDPNISTASSSVRALALDGNGNLYVGGTFGTISSQTRNNLCKLDASGSLTSFNPNMSTSVLTLALDGSSNLYVGGTFTTVGGSTVRNRLCKFDASGSLTSFDPNVSLGPGVYALAVEASGNVYAGGEFTIMGPSISRNRLCKFDVNGDLTSFNPNINNSVRTLAVDGNNNLYVGGSFTQVGGSTTRNRLCKFDASGNLTPFDPNISSSGADVRALVVDGNNNLYVGGFFTQVGGSTTRNRLCKFDASGNLTSFDPNISTLSSSVIALAVDGSNNLYVGGTFTQVGGSTTRNRLCKFDASGNLTSFDPNINNPVNAFAIDGSGNLYVGGGFTIVSGLTRNYVCQFDASGNLTTFAPNIDGGVFALAIDGSNDLYMAGGFTTVGGQARSRLCQFDATGLLTSFAPVMGATINTIAVDANNNLLVGGNFAAPAPSFVIFQEPIVLPLSINGFEGRLSGNSNVLSWQTEDEKGGSHFMLERSSNGVKWTALDKIDLKGEASYYDFEDKNPLSLSYYRLKMVESNGKFTYSKVIALSRTKENSLLIYPNPAQDYLTVEGYTTLQAYDICDVLGQIVLRGTLNSQNTTINTQTLAKGLYVLKIGTQTHRFMKQ